VAESSFCCRLGWTATDGRHMLWAAALLAGSPVPLLRRIPPQRAGFLLQRPAGWRDALPVEDASRRESTDDLVDMAEYGCDERGCIVDAGFYEDPSSEFASSEPNEVRRFRNRPAEFVYEMEEVTTSGGLQTVNVSRGELLELTKLRPRDLRAVAVPPLPGADTAPVLASRRGTLLVGLGGVRAIVQPDNALIFGPASSRFLRVFGNQLGTVPPPNFKIAFVESALLALSRSLDAQLMEVRRVAEPRLKGPSLMGEADYEAIRLQRRTLVRSMSQATAVSSQLLSRIDDGDWLEELACQECAIAADADEWEAMLEVYLQSYNEVSRECASLLRDIEDFEGAVSLSLQTRRLRLEQFELSLVISSVSVGVGGLLPGTMGMNLANGYETSPVGPPFWAAVATMLLIVVTLFGVLRGLAVERGLLL